jgi:hypothetical protein
MTGLQPLGRRRRARPLWLTVVLIVVAMAVVFGLGFGVATLIRGDSLPLTTAPTTSPSPSPSPCMTTVVTPAQELPIKDDVVLNIYNSTKKKGLAAQVALDFKREGFRINKIENDPRDARVKGVAEIRFGPNAADAAKLVEYYLAGATMVELDRTSDRVDVAVGRGYTQLADGGAVAAALAKPVPQLSGPGCPQEE